MYLQRRCLEYFVPREKYGSCFPEFRLLQEEVSATIIPRLLLVLKFGKKKTKLFRKNQSLHSYASAWSFLPAPTRAKSKWNLTVTDLTLQIRNSDKKNAGKRSHWAPSSALEFIHEFSRAWKSTGNACVHVFAVWLLKFMLNFSLFYQCLEENPV